MNAGLDVLGEMAGYVTADGDADRNAHAEDLKIRRAGIQEPHGMDGIHLCIACSRAGWVGAGSPIRI